MGGARKFHKFHQGGQWGGKGQGMGAQLKLVSGKNNYGAFYWGRGAAVGRASARRAAVPLLASPMFGDRIVRFS